MITCSNLQVTKIKYSKSLQSQRNEGKIKTSFSFVVNISKYVLKDGIKSSIHPTCAATKHKRVKKKYSFLVFALLCQFYFGL